jgi:glutathione S-transferase
MNLNELTLHHAQGSPNSRRVRIFLAEKGLIVPMVTVELSRGEQHTSAYRAVNPRGVVPALTLQGGSTIGEVPAIWRYIEESWPEHPLLGSTPEGKARVIMWERWVELEGFAPTMDGVRNQAQGLKGRAVAGPHDYEQVPALVGRSRARVGHFYDDLEARLQQSLHVASDAFSAADITALVTIDFASKAFSAPLPAAHAATRRWYETVASRPSMSA